MEFLPILLGGDLNAYGMALAFRQLGIYPSVALGRYRIGVTSHSRIVRQIVDPRMQCDAGRREMIKKVAEKHPEKRPILIGCTDEYASFLIRERDGFPPHYIVPSPSVAHSRLADKAVFYEFCKTRGLKTPATVVLRAGEAVPAVLPFSYPIVLKPAESETYWHHPFEGMKKVWFPSDSGEASDVVRRMRQAGYDGAILLQERLLVEDSDNYVLTVYADRTGRVRGAGFGRVLLEEHTPKGLGNHAAILTEPMPPIAKRLVAVLEDIGYCGFANFDFLKPKGEDFYILEMNLRQGRSNHYLTAAGLNPAELILEGEEGTERPFFACRPNVFWHSYPTGVVYSQQTDGALLRRLKELECAGRAVTPWHTGAESGSLLRWLYVFLHEKRMCARAARFMEEKEKI